MFQRNNGIIFVLFVVHGAWSDWVDGSCAETCGPSTMDQTRTCDNPAPDHGGDDCPNNPADSTQTGVACDLGPCPSKLANNIVILPF